MALRFVVALTLLFATQTAHTQTNETGSLTRFLTLRECIDLALTKNLDVQIQRVSMEIANSSLTSSYGAYDPAFSIFARRDFLSQPLELDFKKQGVNAPYKTTTDSVGGGLNGKLPIGLSYQIGAKASEANAITDFRFDTNLISEFGFTNNPTTNFPGGFRRTNEFFGNAGFTAQQHLLRDAWIDADRTLIYVRRKELKISEQAVMFQIMRTVLAVEMAYYDLLAARELVRVEEKALELKSQFVSETRRRVQVGDLPPLDSEQAETQLELTQTALLAARENLVSRQNTLKFLITDDFRDLVDVDLRPAEALAAAEAPLNRAESFRSALLNRPDLAEARLAIERSDIEIRFYRNQLFPNLDLFGHYGGIGIRSDGSSAVSDALHFRDQEYYYGVILTVPLTRIKERGDYQASKARKELAALQLKRAEQEIFLQIADLVNRVASRFSQVGSSRRARGYAEAALAAEQKKLENGLSTSFIVLQLQETLTAARTAEVQALADYNEVRAQLAFAEGSTMQQHRLEFRWR